MNNNTASKIYAGFSRISITPDYPVQLAGYADIRVNKTITDEVCASCTAIKDDNGNIALLYSVEHHGIPADISKQLKAAVSEATGVPCDNIFLNATHCHTAPFAHVIKEFLCEKLSAVAKEAIADMCECELYAGSNSIEGLVFVRRYICTDGRFADNRNPNPVYAHESKADDIMPLVKLARKDKKDIILANFASHSDTVAPHDFYTISADFVGVARNYIEDKGEYLLSIQMGASGDVVGASRLKGEPSYGSMKTGEYGEKIARAIEEGLLNMEKISTNKGVRVISQQYRAEVNHSQDHLVPITSAIWVAFQKGEKDKVAELLAQVPEVSGVYECGSINMRECLPEYYELELSSLAVGDVAFAFTPYETFSNTAVDIKRASNFASTFVCSLTNGASGYIPTLLGFEHGGYEAYSSSFFPGTAENIANVLVEQLNKLYE